MSAFSRTDIAAAEVGPSGVKDEDNSKLTVNIPSDETVGKCNTCVLAIYYVPIQFQYKPSFWLFLSSFGEERSEDKKCIQGHIYCYSNGCLLELFLCHFIIGDKRHSIVRLARAYARLECN